MPIFKCQKLLEHGASIDVHEVSGLINRCAMSAGEELPRTSKELQVIATHW